MSYGEHLGGQISLPTFAIVVDNDTPTTSSPVLPARHRSLDLSTRPEGHCLSTLLPESTKALANGEHCVIMNHPDIHIEEMIALSNSLDLTGVWPATMAEVASWALTRGNVYRQERAGDIALAWRPPLAYPVTLAIGYANQIYPAVIPQSISTVVINCQDARPTLSLAATHPLSTPVALPPSEQALLA